MNKKFFAASAAFTAAGAAAVLLTGNSLLETCEYTVDTGKLGGEIKAVMLSDLHFAKFGTDNKYLVNNVKKENPDIILIAGDFFDYTHGKSNSALVIKTLEQLTEIAPVYFSPGNHDKRFDLRTGEKCLEYAENAGCTVLDGNYEDIIINGENIRVGGMFDYDVYSEDYGDRWNDSPVKAFLKDFEKTDCAKILLMHRPNTFMYTNDEWDVDVVFSGHDHGGLVRLPFIGGLYAPEQGFFPEYDRGEYMFGKMKMILGGGLEGYYWIPRVFNRPEILSVTIK